MKFKNSKIKLKLVQKKGQAVLEYGLLLVFISLPLIYGVHELLRKIVKLLQIASSQTGVGV